MYDKDWAKVDLKSVPDIKVKPPGPKSQEVHARACRYMTGYSSQVRLFPVAFESGKGVTLTDVDGNTYIDFSSGIYVTSLGHCHPKVSEAVQKWAGQLMNCHDFSTRIKAEALEKIAAITPGDLNAIQFYCAGTEAVEAGLRAARVHTGKFEFFSFFRDFHGKTLGAVSLAVMDFATSGPRVPGYHLVPTGHCYHCKFKLKYPECGIHCVDYLREAIINEGVGQVAGVVLEPIQGWNGSIVYPDDYLPKIRKMCDELGILLIADEILTGFGRTGKWFCCDHYDVVPDVIIMGKSFANGFPVTAFALREEFGGVLEKISASTSYGGNPMACAAISASLDVIQEEGLIEHSARLGEFILNRLRQMQDAHPIIGEVRGKGCLLGMELVKDRETREPFVEAGELVYQKAFEKGLAWVPARQNLRMSPPLIMEEDVAAKALEIIEEAVAETEKELEEKRWGPEEKFG